MQLARPSAACAKASRYSRDHEFDSPIDYMRRLAGAVPVCARRWDEAAALAGGRWPRAGRRSDEPADGAAGAGRGCACAAAIRAPRRWTKRWPWPRPAATLQRVGPDARRAGRGRLACAATWPPVRPRPRRSAAGAGQGVTPGSSASWRTGAGAPAARGRGAAAVRPSPTRLQIGGPLARRRRGLGRAGLPLRAAPGRWPKATPRRSARRWRCSTRWARARPPRPCAAAAARRRRARRDARRARLDARPPVRPHGAEMTVLALMCRRPAQRRHRRAAAPLGAHRRPPRGRGAGQARRGARARGGAARRARGLAAARNGLRPPQSGQSGAAS